MSINKYDKDQQKLIPIAGGQQIWIGTKEAHDQAVSAGTMPNNCLVSVTDDTDSTYSTEVAKDDLRAVTSDAVYDSEQNMWSKLSNYGVKNILPFNIKRPFTFSGITFTPYISDGYILVNGTNEDTTNAKWLWFTDMASSPDFVQYIIDQCGGAGEIVARKMFGDYGIYCDGKIFGLICDDCFYLKPTEAVRPLLRAVELRPPYDGAKEYFLIADVDDSDYLATIVWETCKALPVPKPKKKKE
jgi:TfoX/Sxy family transcriptional regulator of competence genes